jgi:flagellar hook assembly protein FlgD
LPGACRLVAAWPNPFNPATTLAFELDAAGPVRLTIHDVAGRRVRKLVDGARTAGRHDVRWDGRDDAGQTVAAGVYLARVVAAGGLDYRKLVLVK